MEEKFNWDLPADPDPKSDNYYNGIISKELKDPSNVGDLKLAQCGRNWWKTKDSQNQLHPTLSKLS